MNMLVDILVLSPYTVSMFFRCGKGLDYAQCGVARGRPKFGGLQMEMVTLKVADISESAVALRGVSKDTDVFMQLVDSIKKEGLLTSFSVRKELVDGEEKYYLIDGLQRFTACKEAGIEEVICVLKDADENKAMILQIIANSQRVDTRPVEYGRQIVLVLANDPKLVHSEVAALFCKSTKWVAERLGLLKLCPKAQELVDADAIPLANAHVLAKLPEEEQLNFLERAQTEGSKEFMPAVNTRIKEIRDAARSGQKAGPQEYVPPVRLRKMIELKEEMDSGSEGARLAESLGLQTPAQGFAEAIKWTLHQDVDALATSVAKNEARIRFIAENAARRKEEREAKKAKEAVEKAAS